MASINRSPCTSCPYRKDVPSGIWGSEEYDKIVRYDSPTYAQPPKLFMCHQVDGSLCRGWLDCHGRELLAIRIAISMKTVSVDDALQALDEEPFVPVFSNASEAARHGRKSINKPGKKAKQLMKSIEKKRGKRNV